MSKELTKKAVDMLLRGATMVSDPCPYFKGVRIIKDGNAFCVNCGKEGKTEKISEDKLENEGKSTIPTDRLDIKLQELAKELEHEKDYGKQQQIIRSINEIISIKEKLKKL